MGPGMWSRPLRGGRAAAAQEYASLAGRQRHRGPERLLRRDLTRQRLERRRQPLICEPAVVVGLPGARLVVPSPV
jgi:hypothetical protein